ncbi:zebrafish testis-expressed 38 isoform X1 [Brienomyrus brachyistius]|uniref:zebrafish testis-expressed 38 isoform X1 n=2 Tax=Brienomyrus brachyistius TaxID=42636 RepID=UPI0020B19B62|nr:zebrafish testis-expressed 38 isoform X1 [Brienomyrus brachyistius]
MATAGRLRKSTKPDITVQWTGLFSNDLKTQEQSLVFVKRMMALAVSSITYLRGIFPEDAYRSRYLEDLCIKLLREDSPLPAASKIVRWMMGCFDALEKGYLQIVLIGVYTAPGDPNHIIESYQFKFRYTAKGPQMDILRDENVEKQITVADTKQASMVLIRKLFLLMQNLDILPNDVFLTMKLYYYDDVTPPNYEPPGFREGLCDSLWFEGTAVHFRVGDVQTPFHSMKVQVAVEQGRAESLQKWNCQHETTQSLQMAFCSTGPGGYNEKDHASDDGSADFKKPSKAKRKKKSMSKKLARKKVKMDQTQ